MDASVDALQRADIDELLQALPDRQGVCALERQRPLQDVQPHQIAAGQVTDPDQAGFPRELHPGEQDAVRHEEQADLLGAVLDQSVRNRRFQLTVEDGARGHKASLQWLRRQNHQRSALWTDQTDH